MALKELQNWVRRDWEKRSKNQPSVELQLLYIIEELGEVAEAIRKSNGSKDRKTNSVDLGSEIADLIISIVTLSNNFNVDIDKEIELFKERILKRHQDGF